MRGRPSGASASSRLAPMASPLAAMARRLSRDAPASTSGEVIFVVELVGRPSLAAMPQGGLVAARRPRLRGLACRAGVGKDQLHPQRDLANSCGNTCPTVPCPLSPRGSCCGCGVSLARLPRSPPLGFSAHPVAACQPRLFGCFARARPFTPWPQAGPARDVLRHYAISL